MPKYLIQANYVGEGIKVLLIGPPFPLGIVTAYAIASRWLVPVAYTGLSLEARFGQAGEDWLLSTFFASASPEYIDRLTEIIAVPDKRDRMRRLRSAKLPWLGTGRGIGRAVLVLIALGEVIAALVLWLNFGWRLF